MITPKTVLMTESLMRSFAEKVNPKMREAAIKALKLDGSITPDLLPGLKEFLAVNVELFGQDVSNAVSRDSDLEDVRNHFISKLMKRATPVLYDSDLVNPAQEKFHHLVGKIINKPRLVAPLQWIHFNEVFGVRNPDDEDGPGSIFNEHYFLQGILVVDGSVINKEGIAFFELMIPDTEISQELYKENRMPCLAWNSGLIRFDEPINCASIRYVSLLEFMNQDVVKLEKTDLTPKMKNGKKVFYKKGTAPRCYVVKLRREIRMSAPVESAPVESAPVNCVHIGDGKREFHWSVRGHWRHQYHGKNKPRELVFIKEHKRGPLDMPLREHLDTVYSVQR